MMTMMMMTVTTVTAGIGTASVSVLANAMDAAMVKERMENRPKRKLPQRHRVKKAARKDAKVVRQQLPERV